VVDCSHRNPTIVCQHLTNSVTCLSRWLEDIGLLLNSKKTQVLFIKPRGGNDVVTPVHCGVDKLETTKSAKYLGVIIDDGLTWHAHVAHLARKTAQTIAQLWRYGKCLSLKARRTWYISMIQARLCYASNCFFPGLSSGLLDRLTKMAKAGIRATLQQRICLSLFAFFCK